MRYLYLTILLSSWAWGWSQTTESRITNVENGLNFQQIVEPDHDLITFSIMERLEEAKIHGASVAVINNGKIEWLKSYGVKEVGFSDPVTNETLFQCASIGKIITALAILQLVQEGKVTLDENVNNKLQRWKIKDNALTASQYVTPRHLLSHTSGLTDDYGFMGYNPKDEIPTIIQILNNQPPANTKKELVIKTKPGTVERYSGAGYLILQLLIEDISGISYTEYVQQNIFQALDMQHSNYDYQPDLNLGASVATGHYSNGKSLKNKPYHLYPEKAAAGPWTTAEDLAKLVIGIQNALNGASNSILNQELAEALMTVQINNKGLGVNLKGVDKAEAFWHAGQNLGYTGLLYGLTESGNGAIILLNSDGGERLMQEFICSVAREYNWPVMNSYKSRSIDFELQNKLVGNYISADESKMLSIEQKKGALFVKSSGSKKKYQLYKIADNHYTFKKAQDYYKISFRFENDDTVMIYTESIGKTVELQKTD